ncbi:unnamed protein product [Brassicogethes aeneus]|uniref:RNA 3'-terminal phosphate cyclase n=1 Tax=Brassicogethes aeneus TaxID=1431903 RepID=A0A9P0AT13_BRAAE|nr:unnamed protein product [Brassicogethes aeneus]
MDLIDIDGSILEGGGQILRIALSLSAIKCIPIRIRNIRANRSKPGLMEQHLKGVELVRDICNAKVIGASLNSTEIEFRPGEVKGGNFKAYIKTAGSISLLLQTSLPCTIFAKSCTTLNLHGGTNAEMAPQIDYTTEIFRRVLEKFGPTFDFDLIRRGYFPRGGGEVMVNVKPVDKLKSVDLTNFGEVCAIYGWSFVAGSLPIKLAHLMADSASDVLKNVCRVNIERYKEDRNMAPDNASGIILVAETTTGCILGSSALGKRNETAEDAGKRAANELLESIEIGACLDKYSQDQVILFMALGGGISKVRVGEITMHTKTAMYVVEKLINVVFEVIPDGNTNIIKCSGQNS